MGDLRDWSPELNGAVLEERPSSSSASSSSNQTAISAEYWKRAEEATQGIIAQVQPTVVSENRRKAVITYVQRVIKESLGCEVFPFGSVPLKTYLPDGDIDLTAFGGINVEEAFATDVCSVLEREDQNRGAEFVVKDVQLIRAEVKLVKCLVQNIVVDISFNQLGGLCTLCFLEEVDGLIGKDHLFKRSIILIKAWCYYESRILGAHHGLISTYALETLVLYIFHLFHSSLNGPLAVLYKFLDYFSKFDWDSYCISLNGQVHISSLPELVAETPETDGGDLLLSNAFLRRCLDSFSVPSRGYDANSRMFSPKHLNIVDPLKENNNLGRSVSKGNFYRIRSAFTYGARKLAHILSRPEENIDNEIRTFFSNTLERHGKGQRPDVQDPFPMSGHDGFGAISAFSGTESKEDQTIYESENGTAGKCRLAHEGVTHGGVSNVKTSESSMSIGRAVNEPNRSSMNASASTMLSEANSSENGITVSGNRLSGDARDLATTRIQGLTISCNATKSSPSTGEESISPLGKPHHAPHLYFSHTNGEIRNGSPDWKQPEDAGSTEKKVSSGLLQAPPEEMGFIMHGDQDENQLVGDHDSLSPVGLMHHPSRLSSVVWSSEDLCTNYSSYGVLTGTSGSPESLSPLSDLSGDLKSHLSSLKYGRGWYEFALSAPVNPILPTVFPQFHDKKSWDVLRRSMQLKQNVFSQMNTNGVVSRPPFYPMNPQILPGGAFGMEEMPKPRGTGTFLPNANHYRERPLSARGRNQLPVRSPRNNGRAMTESNWSERSGRELPQTQFPVHSGGKAGSSDHAPDSPRRKVYSNANGSMHPAERVVEFGSMGHLSVEASLLERSRQQNSGSAVSQNSSSSLSSPRMQSPKPVLVVNQDLSAPRMQSPKPVLVMNQDRNAVQSYSLKAEDFPPLSGKER